MKKRLKRTFHLFFEEIVTTLLAVVVFYFFFKSWIESGNFWMLLISFLFFIYIYLISDGFIQKYIQEKKQKIVISKREIDLNYRMLIFIGVVAFLFLIINLNVFPGLFGGFSQLSILKQLTWFSSIILLCFGFEKIQKKKYQNKKNSRVFKENSSIYL